MGAVMKLTCYLLLLACLGVEKVISDVATQEPKPVAKDQFRNLLRNLSASETEAEVASFLDYGCEVMIVIKNEAQGPVRLRCASKSSDARSSLSPGNSFVFTIKPHVDGTSDFWCNLEYKIIWIRFDAYTEDVPYVCPGKKKLYRYSVRHDGLYADPEINKGNKIRALFKGHNEFALWESYHVVNDTSVTDGLLLRGYVDGGMCSELPDHLDNRAAVVTVCHHQCVLVYDLPRCKGPYEKLQADDGCKDFAMDSMLSHKISAVMGC